ncbi:glycosyltransferase family 1 protein [Dyadobacter diqingensis]|uniref:glycosyltransferase family 1 protein n=1 Tax=Dyadobacter diqingensis TaxID=2938121 RepID=UPI0020C2F000|nr:glycosyltransferase family 1 protein [Dyadobacter diqingensis]
MAHQLPKNLVCFSHLRWDFVFQRPQHLMNRFARHCFVYYVEEPTFERGIQSHISVSKKSENLWVCVPCLPEGIEKNLIASEINTLLKSLFVNSESSEYVFWYYTPMALKHSYGFNPVCSVYDCMDELSAFKFAPRELKEMEKQLFDNVDVVFTGGYSLFEAKRRQHNNIHPFPSSIDKQHFLKARGVCTIPEDQAGITGFKIGFYGVLDERFDIELIENIAVQRPEWQIILIGPVVKIDPATLPRHANIHYLGPKSYDELPLYLSEWDVALIPFLLNESTVFISPTKTPEYLAAGKPVVSTAIKDVVSYYGKNNTVHIGTDAEDFISIIDQHILNGTDSTWLERVDHLLAGNCWENTFEDMKQIILAAVNNKKILNAPSELIYEDDHRKSV